ncbi:hypothetical protein DFJ74DRAFT_657540 [Hyaloraphidium curvatum]|nr:hypothetical protein DFJ74DRAFT_657540 [Hyaloraphidium curvatum]
MLAMFPRSVRRPLLNAMALETGGRPHLAGQWYYVALGKAVEEGVDHQGELVTALIMRWANLESRLGNGKKAMELYENLFWSLVKAPAALEEDGKTWKVEPKDARISRLDRAGLIALYAAGGAEMMDETATEQEAIDWALQWNRRAANAFLAKDGSDAAVTPETVDNDLGWVEVLAPAVGDIAALDFGKLLDEAAAGVKAGGPPDAPSAPKSPLLPFLRPTKNRNVLITAFNNISEYLFVLDAAPSDPALHPPRGGAAEQPKFPELSPSALLRSLSYRLHGVLLDLDGVNDPCGLAVQLTGIMETYASTGRMGAASAEEFGEKAREVALKSLDAGVPNAVGCTECLASVSTILGSMFRTLGDLDRAIKYYRQLEDDLSVLTVGKLAHGVRGVDRQGNRIEDLAGVLPPEERAKPAFGELQAFARSLREEVERERDGRGQ